ncbi:MAG: sigma-70 family RNA polymerase sigma factor [Solirubrobacteraceae bacterium]|nr:sigma-70 family RNA polymerase sigma factor [Solirubrobacteraceae bacterium]
MVARARGGDLDAYGELVRRHQEIAFRTAVLVCGDPHEAEEAVQEALVKAHRALGRFRAGRPLRPWLLAIVANEARNRRRAAGRRARLALRVAEAVPAGARGAADEAGPEAAALAAERRAALAAALDRLPERDRTVIALRCLLDLSEAETAAALGVRRGTVKSRLSRALARLREEVGPDAG